MQLNKIMRIYLLMLPMITITACSSNKNVNSDPAGIKAAVGIENTDSRLSSEEPVRLQKQILQKENIVYFDLDKYNINTNFSQILDAHATFLRNNESCTVTIEGHTDERGTPEYNIALGERRANSVKVYLQGKGVLANQISIVSYGKEKPAVLGHEAGAYSKNRRAILVY